MGLESTITIEKHPLEKLYCGFDMTRWITDTTVVISNPVLTCVPTDNIVISGETVIGYIIGFYVAGGINGKTYKITVEVDASNGETLIAEGTLKVRSN